MVPYPASAATAFRSKPEHRDFRPLPLLSNPHIQTLLGHLLRGRQRFRDCVEHVLRLPDGDALVLHDAVPASWQAGRPVVVLVHGLTGTAASHQMLRTGSVLFEHGMRVVRLDLRGAGKSLPLSRKFYHGGRSEDVRAAVEEMHRLAPESPITLVGVSLGGNMVLKLAGEAADQPVAGLVRVAALAPPIDLGRCAALLGQPRNRMYANFFLRDLMIDVLKRQEYFPDLPPLNLPKPLTVRLFDDLYTAPRSGFDDAEDYYRRSSSLPLIGKIRIPTFVLTARDDPFIAPEPFEELTPPSHVEVRILEHGGHLGFLGWDGAGGIRWAERRIVDWVMGW
jgi:predicted alpha/beta-fold hydrolase